MMTARPGKSLSSSNTTRTFFRASAVGGSVTRSRKRTKSTNVTALTVRGASDPMWGHIPQSRPRWVLDLRLTLLLAGLFEDRRPGWTAMRRHAPAAVGDERREEPHDQRDQSGHDLADHQRDHDRPDHDDDQAESGERCQARPDPQEAGEDQAERAEHLARTDEP